MAWGIYAPGRVSKNGFPLFLLNSRLVLLNTNRGLAHTINGQNAAINRR